MRIPELKRMNIWNGVKGNACAFHYKVIDSQAYIQWSGNWCLELSPDVIIAVKYTRREELIVKDAHIIQDKDIASLAVAMGELMHRPVSE